MIEKLGAKDKKALLIGGICVFAYLFYIVIAQPIFLKQKEILR